jgi:hypothetical protein
MYNLELGFLPYIQEWAISFVVVLKGVKEVAVLYNLKPNITPSEVEFPLQHGSET